MFDTSFINSQNSHARNGDAKNEKVMSFELGYGFRTGFFTANVNAYYTRWKDKALYDSGTYDYENEEGVEIEDRWTLNMTGANANHMGIELDFVAKPLRWLDVTGMFSWGDWRWNGNAKGFYYNGAGQMLADLKTGEVVSDMANAEQYRANIKMDNIHVGGSAQTTAALGVNVRPMKGLEIEFQAYGISTAETVKYTCCGFPIVLAAIACIGNVFLIQEVVYYEGEFTGKYPTEGYFSLVQGDEESGKATIEKALIEMLKDTYPYCDKGSSAKIKVKVADVMPSQEKEPAYEDAYELSTADYDAMGTGKNEPGEHDNFSYRIDPNDYLPDF